MFEDDEDDLRDEDARWEAENEAAEDEHFEYVGRQWVESNAAELAREFFETNYEEAVRVFSKARLQSYYLKHTDVAVPAFGALDYARSLLSKYPQGALVFAVSSVEITLKYGVLKPVISGLIHAEELASLIGEETTSGTGIVRYGKLLLGILNEITNVKFAERKRRTSNETLWKEIGKIQDSRNSLIHRGASADAATIELSIDVADTILNEIFPEILSGFSLHLHSSVICDKAHPATEPGLPTRKA